MLSVLELRSQLGWSQAKLARHVCASIRSVINWESGASSPSAAHLKLIRNVARWHGLKARHAPSQPTRRYNDERMRYYEGKPGARWLKMNGQQRAAFYSQRARYRRLRADLESGRALGQPVTRLLDSAPDLDTLG